MQNLTDLLDFWSAVFGFLSALVLASSTIGSESFASFLHLAERAKEGAGTPDSRSGGVPPAVMVASLFIVGGVMAVAFFSPAARETLFTWRGAGTMFLLMSVGAWILALAFIVLMHGLIGFAQSLHWLEVRRYAGWIGFALLAVAFLLQLCATSIRAFDIPVASARPRPSPNASGPPPAAQYLPPSRRFQM